MRIQLEGLDCANCAVKLEKAVQSISGIESANVNFMTGKLSVTFHEGQDQEIIKNQIFKSVHEIEPNVKIKEDAGEKVSQNKQKDTESSQSYLRDEKLGKREIVQLIVGGIVFLSALLIPASQTIRFILFLLSYFLIGGEVLIQAVYHLFKGKVFDENFLMTIATVGAFAIGEYPEGVAVMLFYRVGELLQSYAVNKSRRSISDLMDIRPDYANVIRGEEIVCVSPPEVSVGEMILVKPGEKIPLDAVVIEGVSSIDSRALTGESIPKEAEAGSEILSGCVNLSGRIKAKVTKISEESTVSKILELVENASDKKAQSEQFITKFARVYTPIVVGVAALLTIIPPLVTGGNFSDWLYRALIFLVISCPCALVISIPLSFFAGIGGASKQGILLKGSNYIEELARTQTVVFDKTGTLTKGVFSVSKIAAKFVPEEELLKTVAYAERSSNHPIARAVANKFNQPIDESQIESVNEMAGLGVEAQVLGKHVLAGNEKLMQKHGIALEKADVVGTVLHIAIDGAYAGYIVISDEIKDDAKAALKNLRKTGIRRTVMLTGDNFAVAENTASVLGIDEVHADLLPVDKVNYVKQLKKSSENSKLAFVGDGINDAPVLMGADIGIAMGGLGSDAAIEAADVVIMTDEPSKIAAAIRISRKTLRIVKQNIIFALAMKLFFLILGMLGFATMWEAVFADVGVSVIAIVNAVRALRFKE